MRTSLPYRILPVEVVTPAINPLMSIEDAKNWLKIDSSADDKLIEKVVQATSDYIENYTKRTLINKTLKAGYDLPTGKNYAENGFYSLPSNYANGGLCFPREFRLPSLPIQSVSSFVTFDRDNNATTYNAANYFVDEMGGRVILNDNATAPISLRTKKQVEITFVAGYGATAPEVPEDIIQTSKVLLQYLYNNFNFLDRESGVPAEAPLIIDTLLNKYVVLKV